MEDKRHLAAKSLRQADLDQQQIRRLIEESEARVREFFRLRRNTAGRKSHEQSASASRQYD